MRHRLHDLPTPRRIEFFRSMTTVADSTIASSPTRLHSFVAWWLSELKAMIPVGVRSWFVGDTTLVDVKVDAATIQVLNADSRAAVVAPINLSDAKSSTALLELRASGRDRVRLMLTSDQLLIKKLQLPMAIEENLREAIGFELDRYTPFKAEQAYYDARVLRRDANKESIEVQLGVAPRAVVDPLLATLRRLDLFVGAIGAAKGVASSDDIDLLPAAERPAQKWGKHLKLNAALAALALGLALLALLLPIWQKREKVLELIPQVAKASAEFTGSQRQYEEYSRLAGQYNYITGRKFGQQPVLVIMEELARISPDTTYFQSLEVKTTGKIREVTMLGEAQSASKVLEGLEQSPLFQNASQRAQTTRGSQPNTERYHVSTEVKPKPLPPMSVAMAEAAAPPVIAPVAPAEPTARPASPVAAGTGPPAATPNAGAVPAPAPAAPVTPVANSQVPASLPAKAAGTTDPSNRKTP
jgi:general secretion pathway protein L